MFKKRSLKRVALSLSLFMIFLWLIMGAGTSLAWFTDRDDELNNIFHFAEFDLVVEYRDENGIYQDLEAATEVFDKEALYEPGYVQVVYLRVKNNGNVPFKFKTAVSVLDYTEAVNFYGQKFHLQEYLKFGIVVADSQAKLETVIGPRENAETLANMPLNRYETNYAELGEQETVYMAVIVRMPREVENIANYRGGVIPRVELGLIVNASQLNAPD